MGVIWFLCWQWWWGYESSSHASVSRQRDDSRCGAHLERLLDLEGEGTSTAHMLVAVERGTVSRAIDRHVDATHELIAGEVKRDDRRERSGLDLCLASRDRIHAGLMLGECGGAGLANALGGLVCAGGLAPVAIALDSGGHLGGGLGGGLAGHSEVVREARPERKGNKQDFEIGYQGKAKPVGRYLAGAPRVKANRGHTRQARSLRA